MWLRTTRVCRLRQIVIRVVFLFRVGLARVDCDLEVTETDLAETFFGGRTVAKKKKAAKKAAPKKKAHKKAAKKKKK